jgi:hypothetical protein
MKNRMAWGLALLLALLLLGGAGIGLRRTYEFNALSSDGDWGFGYEELRGGFHTLGLGRVLVVWSRR